MTVMPYHYAVLGVILFIIGICGMVLRRNVIFILISIEIAINGIFLVFFGASLKLGYLPQALILIIIALAAAEAAVGLALAVAIFRAVRSVNSDELSNLKN